MPFPTDAHLPLAHGDSGVIIPDPAMSPATSMFAMVRLALG